MNLTRSERMGFVLRVPYGVKPRRTRSQVT